MKSERGKEGGWRGEVKGRRRNKIMGRVRELIIRGVLRISMYVVLSNIRKMEWGNIFK